MLPSRQPSAYRLSVSSSLAAMASFVKCGRRLTGASREAAAHHACASARCRDIGSRKPSTREITATNVLKRVGPTIVGGDTEKSVQLDNVIRNNEVQAPEKSV